MCRCKAKQQGLTWSELGFLKALCCPIIAVLLAALVAIDMNICPDAVKPPAIQYQPQMVTRDQKIHSLEMV